MFDLIIANPPYAGNLFLKITEAVLPKTKAMVMLGPVRWLQDPVAEYKRESDYNTFSNVRQKLKAIEVIPAKEFSDMFNADIPSDGALYFFKENGKGWNKNLTPFEELIKRVVRMYKEKNVQTVKSVVQKEVEKGIAVKVSPMFGLAKQAQEGGVSWLKAKFYMLHPEKSYVYEDCKRDGLHWTKLNTPGGKIRYDENSPLPYGIPFNSWKEAKNFEDSTKTNFFRFLYNQIKGSDQNLPLNYLPFMKDYTKPWDDARFYEYFNIHEEEQKEIYNYLKEHKIPNIFGEDTEGILWRDNK